MISRVAQNGIPLTFRNLGNPVAVKLSTNVSFQNAQGRIALINTLMSRNPVSIFNVHLHNSPQIFQQVNTQPFSNDEKDKKVDLKNPAADLISKARKVDDDEPRWFHPSPTERLENPAYTYLRNHPEYQKLFFQHEVYKRLMTEDGTLTPEGEETVNPAVKAFIDLCNSNPDELITDPKYERVFTDLINQSSNLTDVELLLVFYNLRRFPKRPKAKDPDYKKIWQPLDDLCHRRSYDGTWSLEYMFNLADLIFSVGLVTESKFHWDLVKRLYRRVDHLSKEEFIRMMFCFGGVKSLPDTLSIYNIEYNLPKFIDELTPEEVAVVSMGFLRTKTYVQNKEVLAKILDIVAADAARVPSPSVSAVAKAVTISHLYTVSDAVYNFLEAFVSEVPRIDIHACASLVLLAVRARVEHEQLLKEIVKKLEGNVNMMRSKDVDYICSGLTMFNIDCPKFYQEIIEDLQTRIANTTLKAFCNQHGRNFINILHHLSHRNMYPQDLISLALSDEFLNRTYGRSMYTYAPEVLLLDICTGLEADGYTGPRLSDKYRGFLTKKNMLWIAEEEKVSSSEYQKIARFMLELCINTLGGPEYSHICNVVPPFRTIGVVYCINEANGEPHPIPESFFAKDDFDIKYIPEEETGKQIKFHAFVLFPGNQVSNNTAKPNGIAVMHIRQMEKMGYVVHPIYLSYSVTCAEEMREFISQTLGRPVPVEVNVE